MIELISKILVSCAGISWWWRESVISVIFFGESAYPTPEDNE